MAEKKKNRFNQFEAPKPESRKVKPKVPKDDTRGVFEKERKKLEAQKKRDQTTLDSKDKKKKKIRAPDKKILNINERRQMQNT